MAQKIENFIFDIDGTLIDTIGFIGELVDQACELTEALSKDS